MASTPDTAVVQRRLGAAVKSVRRTAGVTQEELSHRTGLHTTYISDIERGARNPSFAVLVRIAGGLGISLGDLGRAYDASDPSA
jgi:transcriptional regulator with XRE-family HTH domain